MTDPDNRPDDTPAPSVDPDADTDTGDVSEAGDIALDGFLSELLVDPATWVEPPAGLGDRVVDAIRSEAGLGANEPDLRSVDDGSTATSVSGRSRRPWLRPALLGAAAAVLLLFGGVVALSAFSGVEEVESFSAELVSTGLIPDVGGDIEVTTFDSGLRIDLAAPGLPRRDDGAFYEGWIRTSAGDLIPVGTFHDGDDVTLWAGVELARAELFTITLETAAGPDDPGQGSSGEVVLRTEIRP